jgi:hypothetical protein
MRHLKYSIISLLVAAACISPRAAFADIVTSGSVDGLATFQDQNTGLVWLDLNNFFGETYNQMAATATADGFNLADESDVQTLLDSIPVSGAAWSTDASIMGSAPNRQLIWGGYLGSTADTAGWAFAFNGDDTWTFVNDAIGSDMVPNPDSNIADMDIFAFKTGTASVPDSASTLALMGGALAGLATLRRRFAK